MLQLKPFWESWTQSQHHLQHNGVLIFGRLCVHFLKVIKHTLQTIAINLTDLVSVWIILLLGSNSWRSILNDDFASHRRSTKCKRLGGSTSYFRKHTAYNKRQHWPGCKKLWDSGICSSWRPLNLCSFRLYSSGDVLKCAYWYWYWK